VTSKKCISITTLCRGHVARPVIDVVLGIEPVRNEEARRDIDSQHVGHEGELTAARRLIDSLHDTYGGFIDASCSTLSMPMGR